MGRPGLISATSSTLDSNFQGVVLSSVDHVAYRNKIVSPHQFYRYAKEIFATLNLCIYMNRKSCLANEINNHILQFKSNGLMQSWVNKFVDQSYLVYHPSTEPKVMGIMTILGSIQILIAGYLISLTIFIVEMLSQKFKTLRDIFNIQQR